MIWWSPVVAIDAAIIPLLEDGGSQEAHQTCNNSAAHDAGDENKNSVYDNHDQNTPLTPDFPNIIARRSFDRPLIHTALH